MGDIGNKIRAERRKRGITLNELARKSNLSKSFISQVERGLAQPSLASLKKIAPPLGHTVATIISEYPDVNVPQTLYKQEPADNGIYPINGTALHSEYNIKPVVRVIPRDKRKKLSIPGCDLSYEIMSPLYNSKVELLFVTANVGDNTGSELLCDESERVGVVLKGIIEISMQKGPFILHEGDSIHIPAYVPFRWTAIEGDVIEVFWFLSPPSF